MAIPIAAILSQFGRLAGASAAAKGGGGQAASLIAFQKTQIAIAGVKGTMESLASAATGANTPMLAMLDTMKKFAAPVAALVKLSNPGPVAQFELVMKDAYAVLGRQLVPVLKAFTYGFQKLGDVFAKLEPIIAPFFETVGAVMMDMFDTIASALLENRDVFSYLAKVAGIAAEAVGMMFKAFVQLQLVFNPAIAALRVVSSLFNDIFGKRKMDKDATSKGAAVRDVRIGNSAEDLAKRAQESAFAALVNGPQKSTEEKQLGILEQLYNYFSGGDFIRDLKAAIKGEAENQVQGGMQAAMDGLDFVPGGAMARWGASLITR